MRAYYDIATEIVPGWRLPSGVSVKRGAVSERTPYLGKTDIVIAYPGLAWADPRKWKTPPHVELANIDYSESSYVEQVRAQKAFSEAWRNQRPDVDESLTVSIAHSHSGHRPTTETVCEFISTYGVLLADPSGLADESCEFSVAEFRDLQEKLREAWRRNDAKALWFPRGGELLDNFDLSFTWRDDLALRPADLWTYIRLLMTRDLGTGHAKVCKWPRCEAPFCVKRRTDGECCSHECAVKFTNWKNSLEGKKRSRKRKGGGR